MNTFVIKMIAIITMTIDHVGAVFPLEHGHILRIIGRVAFPLFVFLLAEGFRHTADRRKFLIRLLVFAIISQPAYYFALIHGFPWDVGFSFVRATNIFYTLFLGGCAICVFDLLHRHITKSARGSDPQAYVPPGCIKNMPDFVDAITRDPFAVLAAAIPVLGLAWLADVMPADYGAFGVVFIFVMYVVGPMKARLVAMFVFAVYGQAYALLSLLHGSYFVWVEWALLFGILASVPIAAFYNGKRGIGLKWAFYGFYPGHLLLLIALSRVLVG